MSWRSLLYVPGNQPRFLAKAQSRGADALILDLEDSVPFAQKQSARACVVDHWASLRNGPADLFVRINGDLLEAALDLDAIVHPGLRGIYVAKAKGKSMLSWLSDAISRLETERGVRPGSVGIVPLLEDPHAVENAFEIARSPRVVALSLGSEDYATACQMEPTPDALSFARQRLVAAARAAGVAPIGLLDSVARLKFDDILDLARRSRAFGFAGATAIHPDAVQALNTGFAPSDAEVHWANEVLRTLTLASQSGRGAARLGDRMVDEPMAQRARTILNLNQKLSSGAP